MFQTRLNLFVDIDNYLRSVYNCKLTIFEVNTLCEEIAKFSFEEARAILPTDFFDRFRLRIIGLYGKDGKVHEENIYPWLHHAHAN